MSEQSKNAPAPQAPQAPANPFGSRFGQSRFGGATSNNKPGGGSNLLAPAGRGQAPANAGNNPQSPAPQPAPRPGSRLGGLARRQQINSAIFPIHNTAVHFELEGLGDPFYKVLGQPLNIDYGDSKAVTRVLEEAGETVTELTDKLNTTWEGYAIQGAMMVYRWDAKAWGEMATLPLIPGQDSNLFESDDDSEKPTSEVTPNYTCLRALDLQLVLNVLARARTQVLLANAPLVFSQQYLNRSLVTDDPRLVKLVRATGYIQEKL